ncbi:MAG TPA: hypothetical protein VF145_09150 [Chitinophagaceae bacterium]
MRKIFIIVIALCHAGLLKAQQPVDVAENTVKVGALGGEQVFYYGFAEGDEILFNFVEVNGKELKEVEIIEYPSNSRFTDYKTRRVDNKRLKVSQGGIYKFRFYNSSIGGRVCKFNIQRIPAGETTKNFNTTVYWKTISDTSYYTVDERYVVKSDTTALPFFSQSVKVPAKTTVSTNNRAILEIPLPENTIAWAYYIGAGDEGKEAHYTGREKFLTAAACGENKMPGYSAMAAVAVNGNNYFQTVAGPRIRYSFINDYNNALLFQQEKPFLQFKSGNVVNEASAMKRPLKGKAYLGFINDNGTETEVLVKATAITVVSQYDTRTVQKMNVSTRQEPYLKN